MQYSHPRLREAPVHLSSAWCGLLGRRMRFSCLAVCGLLAAMLWSSPLSLVDAVGLALGSALQQIDMGCKQRRTAAEILSSLSADPSR